MDSLSYNGVSLVDASYGAIIDNWDEPGEVTVGYANLFHGEPIPSSAELQSVALTGHIWVKNPTGTTTSLRDAEEALKRILEMGTANKATRTILGRKDSTRSLYYYRGVCSQLVRLPDKPFEWAVRFDVQPVPYHNAIVTSSTTLTTMTATTLNVTPGGTAPTFPTLRITPTSAPAGRWRYGIGPLKCDSPANIPLNRALRVFFTGAGAEVTALKLRADYNDLEVVTADGRVLKRWTQPISSGNIAVWFQGLRLDSTPDYVFLRYGNPDALSPSRWGPPENVRAVTGATGTRYYRVSCVGATGETLASAVVQGSLNSVLRWDRNPSATSYRVYRGAVAAGTEQSMWLVGVVGGPRFDGTDAVPGSRHPRVTGSNPPTPYNLTQPIFDIGLSNNARRYYNNFARTDRPGGEGTWDAVRLEGRATRWARRDGIVNRRSSMSIEQADAWQRGDALEINRVAGQVTVQEDSNYYEFKMLGRTTDGDWVTVYDPEARLRRPEYQLHDTTGTVFTPNAHPYVTKVTARNSTGETISGGRETRRLSSTRGLQVYIHPVPGATDYPIYCSPHDNPRWAMTTTLTGQWVTITAIGTSATNLAPTVNTTSVIYPTPTTLAAFNNAAIVDSDGAAVTLRSLRFWLDEIAPNTSILQQAKIVYLDYYYASTQAPTVADAVNTAAYEMPHLELTAENTLTRELMTIDMIEAAAGKAIVIDCDKKTISRDAEGDPQMDAISLDSERDTWLTLIPGVVNPIVFTVTQRTGAAAPNIAVAVDTRARGI